MKICFVAPRLHTNQNALVYALLEAGHEVQFITYRRKQSDSPHPKLKLRPLEHVPASKLFRLLTSLPLKLLGVTAVGSFQNFPNRQQLKEVITEASPDILIVRDALRPVSLLAFWYAKRFGIQTILYDQHPIEAKPYRTTRVLQWLGLVPKKRISPTRQDPSHTYVPRTNSYYVPLSVLTPGNLPEKTTWCQGGRLNLLFIGKYSLPRKNHLMMLEAVKNLRDSDIPVHLTMLGASSEAATPYLEKLHTFIKENGLDECVTLKTNVPYDAMPEEYRNADVLVIPSVDEPFSISVIEAMAHGLAVIVSNSNGAQYCVQDSRGGYVLKDISTTKLAKAVKTLATDSDELENLSHRSGRYFTEHHSSETVYQKFMFVLVTH